MQDTHDELDADGIPTLYRNAVQEFATHLELDADALVRGERLNLGGMGFWLQQYGHLDPTGITIMVDLGELPQDPAQQIVVYRQLLENNITTPAGLSGCYGVIPDSSVCVLSVRIALDKVESGGHAVGQFVTALLEGFNLSHQVIVGAVDELVKQTADADMQAV
ncbi:MAG: hypothetical protein AB7P37_02185 [Ramlibacter sp.]